MIVTTITIVVNIITSITSITSVATITIVLILLLALPYITTITITYCSLFLHTLTILALFGEGICMPRLDIAVTLCVEDGQVANDFELLTLQPAAQPSFQVP